MLEQEQVAQQFQSLLDMERQAEALYAALAAKVTDPAVRAQIEQLRRDKQRHIRLTERLLEIVNA
jgi:rubrerythrin